jgi:hypothetical protein
MRPRLEAGGGDEPWRVGAPIQAAYASGTDRVELFYVDGG